MLTATVILTGVILIGCEKKQIETNKIINIEFGFNDLFNKNTIDFFNINYNFENPLLSQSEDLTVVEVINKDTGLNSFIIIKKEVENNKKFSVKPGYWYDGDDCFIYGTIVTGDNGGEIFIAADLATQSTMNVCGYRYVC